MTAALELHGIDDPHTVWTVFSARAEALSDLHDRLQGASEYLPRVATLYTLLGIFQDHLNVLQTNAIPSVTYSYPLMFLALN